MFDLQQLGHFLSQPDMIDVSMKGNPVGLAAIVISSLVTGALLVMWIGELITEYGVGNGASLIIMAGIIASLPASIAQLRGSDDYRRRLRMYEAARTAAQSAVREATAGVAADADGE